VTTVKRVGDPCPHHGGAMQLSRDGVHLECHRCGVRPFTVKGADK
jgi:hypothetical protein